MTNYSHPKLLPCAHCGSTDVRLIRSNYIEGTEGDIMTPHYSWHVECFDCGISTQYYDEEYEPVDMDDYTFAHVAMDDAIACTVEAWNKRVDYSSFGG